MWTECTRCGKIKPLYEFHKNRNNTFAVASYCKQCAKNFYNSNRKQTLKRLKTRYYGKNDQEIAEVITDGYIGEQWKTLKTECYRKQKSYQITTTIDYSDLLELEKIKDECGLKNLGFIFKVSIAAVIKLYKNEKTFPEWKSLFKEDDDLVS